MSRPTGIKQDFKVNTAIPGQGQVTALIPKQKVGAGGGGLGGRENSWPPAKELHLVLAGSMVAVNSSLESVRWKEV